MPKPRKIQYNGESKIINALVNVANWMLSANVDDLNNVFVEELSNGQILKYNATTQKWENANEIGGVIANPTGTPTDELDTIQIGETIYDIVGGGGGGGGSYTETELYTGISIVATVNLSESFESFDAVQFTTGFLYSGRTYLVTSTFTKTDMADALANQKWLKMGNSTDSYCYGKVAANNQFTDCYGIGNLYSIKGIKYGGGSGGGSSKRDILYTANAQADTYSLLHPLTDYDEIWCFVVGGASGVFATSRVFDCDTLMEYAGIDMRFGITTDGWYSYFTVTNASTLVRADTGVFWMKKIIGIKH